MVRPDSDETQSRWSLRSRARAIHDADRGLIDMIRTQPNAVVHLASTVSVVAIGLSLSIAPWQWAAVWLAIGLVWTAEAFNTAIEYFCDAMRPEHDPLIGKAKDAAAAAVMLASMSALLVGLSALLPSVIPWVLEIMA